MTTARRELFWGLGEVGRETNRWRRLAEEIPDGAIRSNALDSLVHKRGNLFGAAFFSTLVRNRNIEALRSLASFQAIFDFLDNLNETHTSEANGLTLHLALIDAIEPNGAVADYYSHHPWKNDGGYLRTLVDYCSEACRALPSYERIRPLLVREVLRAQQVLTLNHLQDPTDRDSALKRWAEVEFPGETRWTWFELCAAASGQVAILALLSLAAEPDISDQDVEETYAAYWPLLPLVATMLDSFVDQPEDIAGGNHIYLSHYPNSDQAVSRVSELTEQAAHAVMALPNGHSHAVAMSCMITFHLSKDSARSSTMRRQTAELIRAGGSLTRLLAPILRAWRSAYSLASA